MGFLFCFPSRSPKPDAPKEKEKGKKPRVWDLGNSNAKVLDYSNSIANGNTDTCPVEEHDPEMVRFETLAYVTMVSFHLKSCCSTTELL